jgi:RNA polymerase sigma-70 factor (ECF subfamily)
MSEEPQYRDLDDRQLLQKLEGRDQHALAQLYERYGAMVYSLAYRVTGTPALAEETTQDTFMKVWNQASRWDPDKGRFSSWLLTVTRYTAIDRLRQEQRHNSLPIDKMPEPVSRTGIPHDPRLQDGNLLRELLSQIPPEQALLIEKAFFQGMTHSELADTLNIPLGTIKTRVRLGLQKLRGLWLQAMRETSEISQNPADDASNR